MKTAWGSMVLLLVLSGCGGGASAPVEITDPETVSIQATINGINAAETKEAFDELFVGDAPAWKEFTGKYYIRFPQTDPQVSVNGDTAEVKVDVSQEGADGFEETASKTWTLQKSGDKWKVQSGPVD